MIYLMIVIGLNFVPLLGSFLVPVLLPSLNLILANACRLIDKGELPSNELLGVGLREQRRLLLRLGVFQLGASLILFLIIVVIEGGMSGGDKVQTIDATDMLLHLMLLAAPVLLAFWFAPLLTGWDKVTAGKAIFFSLVACWRNLGAFLVYALGIVVIAVLLPGLIMVVTSALVPGVIGALSFVLRTALIVVLTPILMAGPYVTYRDVFRPSAPATPAAPIAAVTSADESAAIDNVESPQDHE